MSMTVDQLAAKINATIVGDGSRLVHRCAAIESAGPDEVAFVANSKYVSFLATTKAGAVVVDRKAECPNGMTRLVADDPYFAFRNAMIALHGFRTHSPTMCSDASGTVSSLAVVHPTASIGEGTQLHPHAVVERGARVGRNCMLYPGVFIGPDALVGDDCLLFPNVVVYDRCILGNRVTLHSNTVIGQDGFGFATHKGAHHKIPQTGIVVIEDDVEMGAGCAIERAAVGETRIGKGTKFADLISIGHGTTIGEHCLFVSLVGVSGSVEIGNYVALGGQAGVVGHLKIGDRVQAAGRTVIVQDVPAGLKVGGTPAIPLDKAKRNALAFTELYEMFKRLRSLEKEVEQLREAQRDTGIPTQVGMPVSRDQSAR